MTAVRLHIVRVLQSILTVLVSVAVLTIPQGAHGVVLRKSASSTTTYSVKLEYERNNGASNYTTAVFPDGKQIISGGDINEIWTVKSAKSVYVSQSFRSDSPRSDKGARFLFDPNGWVTSIRFSPNRRLISTGSVNEDGVPGTLMVWDANRRRLIQTLQSVGSGDAVFSPDGQRIAGCTVSDFDKYNTVTIWSVGNWKPVLRLHLSLTGALAFSPDGRLFAIGQPHSIRIVDTRSGKTQGWIRATNTAHMDWVDRHTMVAVSDEGASVIDPVSDRIHTLTGANNRAYAIATLPSQHIVAVSSYEGNGDDNTGGTCLSFWDYRTGKRVSGFRKTPYEIDSLTFSPDGTHLFSTTDSDSSDESQSVGWWTVIRHQ